jgi:hypothetical protein
MSKREGNSYLFLKEVFLRIFHTFKKDKGTKRKMAIAMKIVLYIIHSVPEKMHNHTSSIQEDLTLLHLLNRTWSDGQILK